jgi:hypothetical protein
MTRRMARYVAPNPFRSASGGLALPSPRFLLSVAAALLAGVAAPASATAADLSVTPNTCLRYIKPYVNVPATPSFGVRTTGWPASSALSILVGSTQVGTAQADPAGSFAADLAYSPPPPPHGWNMTTMNLKVQDAAGNAVQRRVKVVRLTVDVPATARPSQKVAYRAFGFSPKRKVYLFVRRAKKTKGRFVLGRPKGDCGKLTKKLRYMPLKHYKLGTYDFEFTQSPKYSANQVLSNYAIKLSKAGG